MPPCRFSFPAAAHFNVSSATSSFSTDESRAQNYPQQVLAELDVLLSLGWMKQVFIVDDNFIGNHQRALELCVELEKWQQAHGFPVMFYTEASMDLAGKTALIEAMVKANFFYVFLGIESPSKEALRETRKFQNLAMDPVSCIDLLHQKGLWVTGGFIVGFDSDTEDIFDRQIEFIERAAIPWALLNSLHAMPHTALYERMRKKAACWWILSTAAATPILPTSRLN